MFQKEDPDFLAALNQQTVPTTQVTPKPGCKGSCLYHFKTIMLCFDYSWNFYFFCKCINILNFTKISLFPNSVVLVCFL